jgi:hypothetical protein
MIGTDQLSETLAALFSRPNGGVVGLVDGLLPICLEHNIELELEADHSRARFMGGDWEELKSVALPPSAFRAVLARVAVLCGQSGHAISPYGGEAEISLTSRSPRTLRVTFSNTPTVQRLAVTPVTSRSAVGSNGCEPDHGNESRPVVPPGE